MSTSNNARAAYRAIPAVDEILSLIRHESFQLPHALIRQTVRQCLTEIRSEISSGNIPKNIPDYTTNAVIQKLQEISNQSLQSVINGTGIILHTGLGRAPVSKEMFNRIQNTVTGYTSVELDVPTGKRGERTAFSNLLLNSITGAESSIIVNNNAAAVLIMLNTIAEDKEVLISRGQQVEIGGSFRIPDVISKSGCRMVEVGTTNRTHLKDYANAITKNTGAILVAHTSNYKVEGFTKGVELSELAALCRKKRIPLIVDLGSGALADFQSLGLPSEPLVKEILKQGASLVSFSGDKLLGGPQAGIICGKKSPVRKIHKNPLYRSLRCDKFIIALLEVTLRRYYTSETVSEHNLAISLFKRSPEKLMQSGEEILAALNKKTVKEWGIQVVPSEVEAGSGSLPTEKIPSAVLEFTILKISPSRLAQKFRDAEIPVIGYIHGNRFRIDLKAVLDSQISTLIEIIQTITQ